MVQVQDSECGEGDITFSESQFIKYTGYIPSYNLVTCCLWIIAQEKAARLEFSMGFFFFSFLYFIKRCWTRFFFFFSFSPSNLVPLWMIIIVCSWKAIHSSDRSCVLPRRRYPCVGIIPLFQFFIIPLAFLFDSEKSVRVPFC